MLKRSSVGSCIVTPSARPRGMIETLCTGSVLGKQLGYNRMSRFMVCGIAPFLFRHNNGLTLSTHENLVLGSFEVLHVNQTLVAAPRTARPHSPGWRDPHLTFPVCLWREFRHGHRVQWALAHVNMQDLFGPGYPAADGYLTVETAGAQQRGIKHVRPVGGGYYNDAGRPFETIHFDQQLIQRLFALMLPPPSPAPR